MFKKRIRNTKYFHILNIQRESGGGELAGVDGKTMRNRLLNPSSQVLCVKGEHFK